MDAPCLVPTRAPPPQLKYTFPANAFDRVVPVLPVGQLIAFDAEQEQVAAPAAPAPPQQAAPADHITLDEKKDRLARHKLLRESELLERDKAIVRLTQQNDKFKAALVALRQKLEAGVQRQQPIKALKEQYEQMTAQLDTEATGMKEECATGLVAAKKQRDDARKDLQTVQTAFDQLNRTYAEHKTMYEELKNAELSLQVKIQGYVDNTHAMERKYDNLKARTLIELETANQLLASYEAGGQPDELLNMRAAWDETQGKIASLETMVQVRASENETLVDTCDILITRLDR